MKDYPGVVSEFMRYKSINRLKHLAEYPYDLTKEGNLNPQRLAKFCSEACGYKLLYGARSGSMKRVMHNLLDLLKRRRPCRKWKKCRLAKS
ncbi:MAG: hypothetical protein LLG04_04110 [Parachlamydia sp.]|nr:hypothetical protein [Parachlamydia sp.]